MKYTKKIKGESYNLKTQYYDYCFKGQLHWVQGELHYNKEKNRMEHIHYGKRGGKYLVLFDLD
jgi:hypothetical protein